MLFPAVFHKDKSSCFGVTIPDIPGCFTAGDTLDEAIQNVQEAVECHLHGEEFIPSPSPLEGWLNDPKYAGGVWIMVDLDLSFLELKARRINISMPEKLLKRIDDYTERHHLSRSGFLAKAADQVLQTSKSHG